jgi:predicted DNA-binding transcriptional regulator AlpA
MNRNKSRLASCEDDRILTHNEWCQLNGFSRWTGWRIRKSGNGPIFRRLSERVFGCTVAENRRWLQSREQA